MGGFIRDALIGKDSQDRDYAVKDPEASASLVRELTGGSLVRLKEGQTIRITLSGGITLDFTGYGQDVAEDLCRRDFTFNAMAFSPSRGHHDPFGGMEDLKKGRVRMVREDNLAADPVRLLRAYRFVGELDGFIEEETVRVIKRYRDRLRTAAPERITSEFFKLIQSRAYLKGLESAFRDGVAEGIIPLENKALERAFQKLVEVNRKLQRPPEVIAQLLQNEVSQGLTLRGLIVLEVLLREADLGAVRLSLSRKTKTRILGFRRVRALRGLDDGRLFDAFSALGDSILEAVLIEGDAGLLEKAQRFIAVCRRPLLNGEEIKEVLRTGEGPWIGRLLREIKRAQFTGRVRERSEAVRYLKGLSTKDRGERDRP